jgi:uncharacterized protein YuzE
MTEIVGKSKFTHQKNTIMAITQETTLDYLKILPILRNLPKHSFQLVYDDEADVVCIDFYNPPKSSDDTELTDDDVIIRYGESEEIVGLTILNASNR